MSLHKKYVYLCTYCAVEICQQHLSLDKKFSAIFTEIFSICYYTWFGSSFVFFTGWLNIKFSLFDRLFHLQLFWNPMCYFLDFMEKSLSCWKFKRTILWMLHASPLSSSYIASGSRNKYKNALVPPHWYQILIHFILILK